MSRTSTVAAFVRSTLFRYVLVGGLGFLFELLVLFVALNMFDASTALAVTLSFWLGLVFSFLFQKLFAFGNRDRRPIALGAQGLTYAALVLVNYGFTVGFAAVAAPFMGVYLARAISLLITTAWNFFAYKHLIFRDRSDQQSTALGAFFMRVSGAISTVSLPTVAITLATALVAPLVLLPALANLVADDYSYFTNIDAAGSPFAYAVEHYLTHNGRLSQALLVAVSYTVFGVHAVKIVPVLLLVIIVFSLAWVIGRVLVFRAQQWQSSLALSASVVAVALYSMPSFFDTYLWLTSSTVYLGSIAVLLLNTGLTLTMAQSARLRPGLLAVALFSMTAGQTFSEPTALFAILAWGVWWLWLLCTRSWRNLWIASGMCIALIVGFLTNYLSPGTRSRSSDVGTGFDLRGATTGALGHYEQLTHAIAPWAILTLILAAALVAANLDLNRGYKRSARVHLLAIALLFVGTTYFVFFASEVGSTYYPLRNFTLPVFGTVVAITALFIAVFVGIFRFHQSQRTHILVAVAFLACGAVIVPFASQHIALQAQGLALRDSAIAQRTAAVSEQLSLDEGGVVSVGAAPVLTLSEAYDIQNPGTEQAEWVIEPFRIRAGIPASSEMEILATPPSYCLPAGDAVKQEFFCR